MFLTKRFIYNSSWFVGNSRTSKDHPDVKRTVSAQSAGAKLQVPKGDGQSENVREGH